MSVASPVGSLSLGWFGGIGVKDVGQVGVAKPARER